MASRLVNKAMNVVGELWTCMLIGWGIDYLWGAGLPCRLWFFVLHRMKSSGLVLIAHGISLALHGLLLNYMDFHWVMLSYMDVSSFCMESYAFYGLCWLCMSSNMFICAFDVFVRLVWTASLLQAPFVRQRGIPGFLDYISSENWQKIGISVIWDLSKKMRVARP